MIRKLLEATAQALGCQVERISCTRNGDEVFNDGEGPMSANSWERPQRLSGPSAVFRLSSGKDLLLTVALHQSAESPTAADIAFRFLQRLSLATAERIERLLADSRGSKPRTRGSGFGSCADTHHPRKPYSNGPRLASQSRAGHLPSRTPRR